MRILGRKILEVIGPDTFEDDERRRLEAELRRAHGATRLTLRARGDGTSRVAGVLPESVGARLRTYLSVFTSPRHDAMTSASVGGSNGSCQLDSRYLDPVTAKRAPHDRVLGEAFCAFLEAADPARMSLQGGAATTVMVTIDNGLLRADLGTADLAGEPITAGIIPAILGRPSEVLALGRTRRLFSRAQRKALAIRYPTCVVDGCDVPAPWRSPPPHPLSPRRQDRPRRRRPRLPPSPTSPSTTIATSPHACPVAR